MTCSSTVHRPALLKASIFYTQSMLVSAPGNDKLLPCSHFLQASGPQDLDMHRLVLPLATLVCLIMQNGSAPAATSETLSSALAAARADSSIPFHLRVDCTDQDSRRSLEVIRGQVAVWGNDRQVGLSGNDRDALIDLLLNADFANFAPRYGETQKADKQEAPLRVSCRIHIALQGVEKSSVQHMDGEQSEQLLGLARKLLDRLEPLAADGVTATTLEDGLTKLAGGVLAAELLDLRLVMIPDAGATRPGAIVRIERGQILTQDYTPGTAVGPVSTQDLKQCQLQDVISSLRDARLWELPINVYAETIAELEVRVLSQRKTVIARPTFDPAPSKQQTAFVDLLSRLAGQLPACSE